MKSIRSQRHKALIRLLIAEREAAGLRQFDLAKKLRQHQSWVARLESGQRRVDVVEFLIITEAIGCRPAKLISKLMKIKPES